MQNVFLFSQAVLSVFLIVLILIQPKGTGLGKALGGTTASSTRRGVEKVVFRLTFVVAALFVVVSVLSLIF